MNTRAVVLGCLLATGVAAVLVLAHVVTGRFSIDVEVYRDGAVSVVDGRPLYGFTNHNGLVFTYPPFAAIVFVPLAFMGTDVTIALWAIMTMGVLYGVIRLTRGPVLRTAVAVLPLLPVALHLWCGQVNLVLMFLVLFDLSRPPTRWQGAGVGIAAGFKLTALVFVPYLLITRRYRAALVACGTFLGTVGVGYVLLPADSGAYWGGAFLDTSRVVPSDEELFNQSLSGLVARLPIDPSARTPLWLASALVVLVVGLVAAGRCENLMGLVICGFVGLLVSPVSWPHHWVWCVPLLVLVTRRSVRVGLWVVFFVADYWVVSPSPDKLWNVFTSLFVVVAIVLVAACWSGNPKFHHDHVRSDSR